MKVYYQETAASISVVPHIYIDTKIIFYSVTFCLVKHYALALARKTLITYMRIQIEKNKMMVSYMATL